MTNNVMLGSPYAATFTRWGLEKHSAKINAIPCLVLGLSTTLPQKALGSLLRGFRPFRLAGMPGPM